MSNYSSNETYDIVRHVLIMTWRLDACMCTLYTMPLLVIVMFTDRSSGAFVCTQ